MSTRIQVLKSALFELSLSKKIVAISALSSLVTLVALCSISFFRDWQSFRERKINSLSTLAEIMSANTVASLRFGDSQRAKEYVDSLQHETDIHRVAIYDSQGELFAEYVRKQNSPSAPSPDFEGARWNSEHILYAKNVMLDERLYGKILIAVDTASFRSSVLNSLVVSISLLLGGLAITVLLAYRLQRLITSPVRDLVNVTKHVTEREDFSKRALKRYNDEVGSLVDSFNAMLDRISQRDASLREMNARLERTVEKRTEDLRNRNIALEEAMEAANAASVAKSEFLATTSHELRTPLNPIIGYVEKMQRENPDGPYARELALVRQSADQLLRLIDDVLDFSRIERGTLRLSEDKVDVHGLCQDVVSLMEPQASEKSVKIEYERKDAKTHATADCLAIIDEGRLRQVLLNLVSNEPGRRLVARALNSGQTRSGGTGAGHAAHVPPLPFRQSLRGDGRS